MVKDFGTLCSMCVQYTDPQTNRHLVFFDLNANNDLTADLFVAGGFTTRALTTWGTGSTD